MTNRFKKTTEKPLVIILLLFLAAAIAHGVDLSGQFKALDDKLTIVQSEDVKHFSAIPKIFRESFFGGRTYYRPLVNLSYLLEYKAFGLKPFFFQLTNLILHALCAALVCLIVLNLTRSQAVGWFAGLLFAVHPVNWEAVANISGRAIILSTFFYLLSFWFYIACARGKERVVDYLLSLVFFSLSLLSKETAATLPFMLCAFEIFVTAKEFKVKRVLRLAPFFILLLGYLLIRQKLGITGVVYWQTLGQVVLAVMTFLRGVITWLRLIVFPSGFYFDRAIRYFDGWGNIQLWFSFAFFAWVLFLAGKYRRQLTPSNKFFICWSIIAFLPVSQILPLPAYPGHASIAEHFVYLPAVGIFALGAALAVFVFAKAGEGKILSRGLAVFLAVSYFIFLATTTISQSFYGRNEIAMLKQSLQYAPDNTRIRISYGLALAEAGRYQMAEKEFRIALKDAPNDPRAQINLAKSLVDQGKLFEGIAEYERIQNPGKSAVLLKENLRLAYQEMIRRYKARLTKDLDNPQLYYSLGVVLFKLGRAKEAIPEFEKALTIDPHYKNALFNLAASYDYLQDTEKAVKYFEQMDSYKFAKDEYDLHALRRLADIYGDLKDEKKKEFYNRKAEELATILEKTQPDYK